MDIVKLAIRNTRLTLSVLVFLVLAGALAYQSVPKEAEPDVAIPDHVCQPCLSGHLAGRFRAAAAAAGRNPAEDPEGRQGDAFRRLPGRRLRAGRVRSVDGSCRRRSTTPATRFRTPSADLPQGAEEPTVNEVNISEFPVMVVTLSGNVPERVLTAAARELRDRIEEVPGVLEGTLQGARDDLVEVDHRSGEAVILRVAARAADPGRRRRPTAWSPPATSKARKADMPSRCPR